MRRFIALFLVTINAIFAFGQTKPYDIEIDGICYKISGNEATVAPYSNDTQQNSDHFSGKITIPESITYNSKKCSVTKIGKLAFAYCHKVTDVIMPNSLVSIADSAFFYDNVGLNSIHIGSGLKEIGKDAFYGNQMKSIDINTDNKSFAVYKNVLYTADYKRAITFLHVRYNKTDDLYLHDNTETIDNGFAVGIRLNSVRFNDALKSIGEFAFQYAFSETENQPDLILPDGIKHIGQYAFYMCIRVNNLHLPDSLERLEQGSFEYVAPVTIHMPKNLKVICDNALACSSGGSYQNLVLPEGLDSIGKYGITSITCDSLIIPSTVRYLSYSCLDNFSKYIEIKAPLDSIATGAMPSQSVKELVLPKTIKRLCTEAFYPCYYLEKIVWPEALEYIGRGALAGNKLEPFVMPATVKTLGAAALADNVWEARTYYFQSKTPPTCLGNDVFEGIWEEKSTLYVPSGCKSAYEGKIPWSYFGKIEEYTEIVIPETPKRYDFESEGLYYKVISEDEKTCQLSFDRNYITEKNTYNYKTVIVPETVTNGENTYTVTKIENQAFYETPLEQISLPKSITSMSAAFFHCFNLASIEIPDNVTDISSAFNGCEKLKTVRVPDKVTNMSSAFYDCISLESVNIPDGANIGESAFYGCESLKSLEFPDDITEIGMGTCAMCYSLESVKLPAQLTQIDQGAFSACKSLTSIVLPAKLDIICTGAFGGCTSLTDITSLNPEPPFGWGYGFFEINDCTLHVPAGSKEAYQNSDTWRYFNIVEDATAIDQIHQEQPVRAAYDIFGRKVSSDYEGLIIRGGKKMLLQTK